MLNGNWGKRITAIVTAAVIALTGVYCAPEALTVRATESGEGVSAAALGAGDAGSTTGNTSGAADGEVTDGSEADTTGSSDSTGGDTTDSADDTAGNTDDSTDNTSGGTTEDTAGSTDDVSGDTSGDTAGGAGNTTTDDTAGSTDNTSSDDTDNSTDQADSDAATGNETSDQEEGDETSDDDDDDAEDAESEEEDTELSEEEPEDLEEEDIEGAEDDTEEETIELIELTQSSLSADYAADGTDYTITVRADDVIFAADDELVVSYVDVSGYNLPESLAVSDDGTLTDTSLDLGDETAVEVATGGILAWAGMQLAIYDADGNALDLDALSDRATEANARAAQLEARTAQQSGEESEEESQEQSEEEGSGRSSVSSNESADLEYTYETVTVSSLTVVIESERLAEAEDSQDEAQSLLSELETSAESGSVAASASRSGISVSDGTDSSDESSEGSTVEIEYAYLFGAEASAAAEASDDEEAAASSEEGIYAAAESSASAASDASDTASLLSDEIEDGAITVTLTEVATVLLVASETVTVTETEEIDTYEVEVDTFLVTFESGGTEYRDEEAGTTDCVWEATATAAGHKFKFRVTFSISGSGTLPAAAIEETTDEDGTVTDLTVTQTSFEIRVPYSILLDKDGNAADSVTVAYPSLEEVYEMTDDEYEEATGFAWYLDEETNEIVIVNFKEIDLDSLTGSFYFDVSYATTKTTYNYYDYNPDGTGEDEDGNSYSNENITNPFYATITVTGVQEADEDAGTDTDGDSDTNTNTDSNTDTDTDGDGADSSSTTTETTTTTDANGRTVTYTTTTTEDDPADGYVTTVTTVTSEEFYAYIDSSAEIESVTVIYPSKLYKDWLEDWGKTPETGTSDEEDGEDNDWYIVWEVRTDIADPATQYYDFLLKLIDAEFTVTYEDGSVATGNLSDSYYTLTSVDDDGNTVTETKYLEEGSTVLTVVAYKLFQETSYTSADEEDANLATDQKYSGYRYDYLIMCLDSTVFNSEVASFTITSTVQVTVDPVDQADEDDVVVTTKTYSWTKPYYHSPTGNIDHYVYGSENRDEDYEAHGKYTYNEYTRYDLELLQQAEQSDAESLDELEYLVETVAYSFAWTQDTEGEYDEDYQSYGQKDVTFTLTGETFYPLLEGGYAVDGTTLLSANMKYSEEDYEGVDPLEAADYDIDYIDLSLTFRDAERDDDGYPVLDEDEQAYIVSKISASEDDVIRIYVKTTTSSDSTDGSSTGGTAAEGGTDANTDTGSEETDAAASDGYVYAGTLNLKTGAVTDNDSDYIDESNTSASRIAFTSDENGATGIDGYRLVISNAYYYNYFAVYPHAILFPTDNVRSWTGIEDNEDNPAQEVVILRHMVNLTAAQEDAEEPFYDQDRIGGDQLIRTNRSSEIIKEVSAYRNSTVSQTYTLTWMVTASEIATTGEGGDDNKTYVTQDSGTFYDLLPLGSTYEDGSALVQIDGEFVDESAYEVEVIDDYKSSGRTMVIIRILEQGDIYTVYLNSVHSWENIIDYGDAVLNPIAYETGNADIGGGYPDDGGYDEETETYLLSDDDLEYMKNLDSDSDGAARFIYDDAATTITAELSAATNLSKQVRTGSDSTYLSSSSVEAGAVYSYRIRYANDAATTSAGIVVFDSLENYSYADGDETVSSDWHGTLTRIDVSQPEAIGIAPVIYYSWVEGGPDVSSEDGKYDLTDSDVWLEESVFLETYSLSDVTGFAVDLSKAEDGSDYTLSKSGSISIVIYLEAPETLEEASSESTDEDGETLTYPEAYNSACIQMTVNGDEVKRYRHEYTTLSWHVSAGLYLLKVSSEDEDVVIQGITFRLIGTSDYGTEVDETATTNRYGKLSFTDLERGTYTLYEYEGTDDWLEDHTSHEVVVDANGILTIDGEEYGVGAAEDGTTLYYTVENDPRVHADCSFLKLDLTDAKVYGSTTELEGVTFLLTGTSDYGTEVLLTAVSDEDGRVTFENLEMGSYELTEISLDASLKSVYYLDDQTVYVLTIDEFGLVSLVKKTDETDEEGNSVTEELDTEDGEPVVYNMQRQSFTLFKQSSYDQSGIWGVVFSLTGTSDFGNEVDLEATSQYPTGAVTFSGLEPGTYILQETGFAESYTYTDSTTGEEVTVTADELEDQYVLSTTKWVVTVKDAEYFLAQVEELEESGEDASDIVLVLIDGLELMEGTTGSYVVTNTALLSDTVQVIKKWVDDGSEDRSANLPTITITTYDPTEEETETEDEDAETESGEAGTKEIEAEEAGTEENETESEETEETEETGESEETGTEETESEEAETEITGTESTDTESTDTGETETEEAETENSETSDSGSEDAGSVDTDTESTETESAASENAESGDSGTETSEEGDGEISEEALLPEETSKEAELSEGES